MSIKGLIAAGMIAVGAMAAANASAATTFSFTFTDPALVGTGTFTIASDPGDGATPLTSVGAFSAAFDVNGDSFTQADITTTPSTVLLDISGAPGLETLRFGNTSAFGDGKESGAIDFNNSSGDSLTFVPPGAVPVFGANAYQVGSASSGFSIGVYTATSAAPEPGTWILMMVAISGIGIAFRQGKKKHGFNFARTLSV